MDFLKKKIDKAKEKINNEEFKNFTKVKKKRLKRNLKHLEIFNKKFNKIKEKSNNLNKNSSTDINANDDDIDEDGEIKGIKEIKEINQVDSNDKVEEIQKTQEQQQEQEQPQQQVDQLNNNNDNNNNDITENLFINNNKNKDTIKYYAQRYRLFSRYDQGIVLDEESWFSVTPELIAQHIAERCSCNTIVDVFCGAGGNTIQFSFTCNSVLSVDLDPMKLLMARHNSLIYGHTLENTNIEFVNCDAMRLPNIKADVIFLSPPWGGPNYTGSSIFHLDSMTPNGFEIFKNAIKITPNIVYFLPKNTSKVDIAKLALISKENGGSEICEVEENYINEKLKTITLYFGSLINNNNNKYNETDYMVV